MKGNGMRKWNGVSLWAAVIGLGLFLPSALPAQQPVLPGAGELQIALQKLSVLGAVLYVGAHPDDAEFGGPHDAGPGERRAGQCQLETLRRLDRPHGPRDLVLDARAAGRALGADAAGLLLIGMLALLGRTAR